MLPLSKHTVHTLMPSGSYILLILYKNNKMSKLFKDNPAFQRTQEFIEIQVAKCRTSTIKIATDKVLDQGIGLTNTNLFRRVTEAAEQMENRMARRLGRQMGLDSKYQAH
jgi:hypothetical protein